MSKHEINNGIRKTPVFHGSSMFFIKRKEFKEVREGKGEINDNWPVKMIAVSVRPLFSRSVAWMKKQTSTMGSIKVCSNSGVYFDYKTEIQNELIQRN